MEALIAIPTSIRACVQKSQKFLLYHSTKMGPRTVPFQSGANSEILAEFVPAPVRPSKGPLASDDRCPPTALVPICGCSIGGDMIRQDDNISSEPKRSRNRGVVESTGTLRAGLRDVLPGRCGLGRPVHPSASAWNPDHVLSTDSDHGRHILYGVPQAQPVQLRARRSGKQCRSRRRSCARLDFRR